MMQTTQTIETVLKAVEKMEEARELLRGGPLSFYLRQLTEANQYLVDRFSPFKVGARVALAETPEISKDVRHGWMGSRHFLVKGAVGTVRKIDCDKDGFSYAVVFDNETWKDGNGMEHPRLVSDRYCFWLREASLVGAGTPNEEST